ncbi:hypothetical protein ACWD3J_46940 [Streptomyces sp. NPDC002755]|uniref:hypothetical protein n=1 Tax=Streptomyces sp. NPDC002884 TaxID=3154544 RepID=UPI0033176322
MLRLPIIGASDEQQEDSARMGSGIEAEFPNRLDLSSMEAPLNLRGEVLAERLYKGLNVQVVVENEDAYTDGKGRYFWTEEQARLSGGRGAEEIEIAIPELIVGISRDGELENRPNAKAMHDVFSDFENAMNSIPVGKAAKLRDILRDEDWRITTLGEGTRVGAPILGSPAGTHSVHYNVGVPLSQVQNFVEGVLRESASHKPKQPNTYSNAQIVAQSAIEFGDAVASIYAFGKQFPTTQVPAPGQWVKGYAQFPDHSVQEVRGLATALYITSAAAALGTADMETRRGSNIKDNSLALVRHDVSVLRKQLPQPAQQFLASNSEMIARLLSRQLEFKHPNLTEEVFKIREKSSLDIPLPLEDSRTVRDLVMTSLRDDYRRSVGMSAILTMTALPDLDRASQVPLVVFEARAYRSRNVDAESFSNNQTTLSHFVGNMQGAEAALRNPGPPIIAQQQALNRQLVTFFTRRQSSSTSSVTVSNPPNYAQAQRYDQGSSQPGYNPRR